MARKNKSGINISNDTIKQGGLALGLVVGLASYYFGIKPLYSTSIGSCIAGSFAGLANAREEGYDKSETALNILGNGAFFAVAPIALYHAYDKLAVPAISHLKSYHVGEKMMSFGEKIMNNLPSISIPGRSVA